MSLVKSLAPIIEFYTVTIGSYEYPSGCVEKGKCTYQAKWKYNAMSDTVEFTIRAKVGYGVWAGIAFSRDRKMVVLIVFNQTDSKIK